MRQMDRRMEGFISAKEQLKVSTHKFADELLEDKLSFATVQGFFVEP
jgi:hypothetical protein